MINLKNIIKSAEIANKEFHDGYPPVEKWNPDHCGEIGLEIKRDGTWFYMGSPIGRKRLVNLFARILRKEKDGSYVLVTPVEKIIIKVTKAAEVLNTGITDYEKFASRKYDGEQSNNQYKKKNARMHIPVSYTHLTLPTNREV